MSLSSAATVATSERVLHVLACVARQGQPMSARDLVAQTGLPLSTIYRHLAALKKWGWVQEHARSGLYEPGPLAVQLAHGFDQHSWLMQAAHSEIEQLVERSGESVGLLCYLDGQVICLDMQESQQALRCSFAKGRVHSTVRGASAKALLAFLPEQTQLQLLDQNFLQAQQDRTALEQSLQLIRQQGYATSENEIDDGVWGVSAPIFSGKHQVIATLSLMAPAARAASRHNDLIHMTLAAAHRISRELQE
ncbi:IclR family transcriptional regulator [Undibacterium sp. Ji67W]|uniref:IclR family transcriptional regulator n=1 Tax=Undibacterium sp. Ji67W TaxID=3413042 RepID=UPI003BF40FFF